MRLNLPSPLSVICHDAGAANIIIAWIKNLRLEEKISIRAYMEGPAADIWKHRLSDINLCASLAEAQDGARALLSGTGWASDLEHQARSIAKEHKHYSVAVLDHWVNYQRRFIRDGVRAYPDEIWVTDDYGYNVAKTTFPDLVIEQKPNTYLSSELENIASKKNVESKHIAELLYICEPMRDHWGKNNMGEFQALDYFVSRLPQINLPSDIIIRLRPHPSDEIDKYNDWMIRHGHLNIALDTSKSISTSIARANWVVGCESFGLVLALGAMRTVYCSLPPWAHTCRLPHKNLIHLKDLA